MRKSERYLSLLLVAIVLSLELIIVYKQPIQVADVHLPSVAVKPFNEILSAYYQSVIYNISAKNFTLAYQMVTKAPPYYPEINSNLTALILSLEYLMNSTSLHEKTYYFIKVNESLNNLDRLFRSYSLNVTLSPIHSLLEEFSITITQQEAKLIKTKILLNVTNSTKPYGNVFISGRLMTYNGTPLPFYTVYVTLLSKKFSVITDDQGYFKLNVTLHKAYQKDILVTAYFLPTDGYSGSFVTAKVFLKYYQPELYAKLNQTSGFEGQNITVYFHLRSISLNNTVEIYVLNRTYIVNNVLPNVTYATIIALPNATGLFNITVYSLPQRDVAPAFATLTVNVSNLPVKITFESPSFAIAGLPMTIQGYTSPKFNGKVLVTIGSSQQYVVVSNGTFSATIQVPFTINTGNNSISVMSFPPYPGSFTRSVFVINVVDFVPLGLAIYLAYYALSSRTVNVERGEKEVKGREESRRKSLFEDPVALAYYQALTAVEKITNVEMKDYYTVREYLGLVKDRLDTNRFNAFSRLTFLLELRIYGNYPVDLTEINQLLRVILS